MFNRFTVTLLASLALVASSSVSASAQTNSDPSVPLNQLRIGIAVPPLIKGGSTIKITVRVHNNAWDTSLLGTDYRLSLQTAYSGVGEVVPAKVINMTPNVPWPQGEKPLPNRWLVGFIHYRWFQDYVFTTKVPRTRGSLCFGATLIHASIGQAENTRDMRWDARCSSVS